MRTLQDTAAAKAKAKAVGGHRAAPSARVRVDCADAMRRDLIELWLARAGFAVHVESAHEGDAASLGDEQVLITDRFGPGLAGEWVIGELKSKHPGLRIVVLGAGDATEGTQLALARVAGADATLATPFTPEALARALSGSA